MKKSINYFIFFLLLFLFAASFRFNANGNKSPKLVVGIVVDQMAYDFVPRYWNKYSEDGFKRLINGGFFCKNTKLVHFPSYTAVGHSGIYTGSVPSIHGIAGNDWYDSEKNKLYYCTDDETCSPVGSTSKEGNMSPANLLSTTITDELINSDKNSKVIAVSLKDRASIFPAGHKGTAYWYDVANKKFITSSYYMKNLPEWVNNFNEKSLPDFYLSKDWNTLLPIGQYTESTEDDSPYEEKYKGEEKPVFPHKLPELKEKNKQLLRTSPFGNSFIKDFAVDAVKNENLGNNDATDFLCVSFSSTDFVGHKFGPNSTEVEDTYLRVDRDISELLEYLDNSIGRDNYLVFLTADHGVCSNPGYLKSKGFQAGTFFTKAILDSLNTVLKNKFNSDSLALYFFNQQVFLNKPLAVRKKIDMDEIINFTADYVRNNIEGVEKVYTVSDLKNKNITDDYIGFFRNGLYEKRCGDVFVNFKKYRIEDRVKGAEHGGPYDYDIHIPLIWYGYGIPKGETDRDVYMTDIAPTLSKLLNIGVPNGCIGKPIKEIIKE